MPSVATPAVSSKPSRPRRRKAPLAAVVSIAPLMIAVHELNQAVADLGQAHAQVVRARRAHTFESSWMYATRAREKIAAVMASTPGLRRACAAQLARAAEVIDDACAGYHEALVERHAAPVVDLAAERERRASAAVVAR